jgi:hypothetical protein
LLARRGLAAVQARSPPGISLLQVFNLVVVGAPSRPLRSWPSERDRQVVLFPDLQRVTDAELGLPLSRLPTCSRFLTCRRTLICTTVRGRGLVPSLRSTSTADRLFNCQNHRSETEVDRKSLNEVPFEALRSERVSPPMSPPTARTLMRLVALECCKPPARGLIWVAHPCLSLVVSDGDLQFLVPVVVRRSLAQAVSSSKASLLFRVLLSRTRPGRQSCDCHRNSFLGVPLALFATSTSSVFFVSSFPSRHSPSATFLTSSTVYSAAGLVGLFRPTATSRVLPPGVCSPHPAEPPRRWPVPSRR